MKKIAVLLLLLISLSACSAQRLDVSIEYNSKAPHLLPTCFWINNNTGEDIPNVEYILNDCYFYNSDLPIGGDGFDLSDFVKRDGRRYDFLSVKPLELKVKSKKGTYAVKFDDIPYENASLSHIPEEYRDSKDVLQYYSEVGAIKIFTKDVVPGTIVVNVELGYSQNDKTTSQELTARLVELKNFLRTYFQSKTIAELKQEEKIKIEIRNQINDNILSKSKIKAVAFTQYDIIEQ